MRWLEEAAAVMDGHRAALRAHLAQEDGKPAAAVTAQPRLPITIECQGIEGRTTVRGEGLWLSGTKVDAEVIEDGTLTGRWGASRAPRHFILIEFIPDDEGMAYTIEQKRDG